MTEVNLGGKRGFHGRGNKMARVAWHCVWLMLFRPSLKPMHAWRRFLLCLFGAEIGANTRISSSAKFWAPWNLIMGKNSAIGDYVDCYCVAQIRIGANSTISQYSYLCAATHDHTNPLFPLLPKAISIGDSAWVAADVFVAPGVIIGEGVVVGARSSVFKDLPEWMICMGAPAIPVKSRILTSSSNL